MTARYHPLAEAEVIEAARFYEGRQSGLGGDFLDAVDAAVEEILPDPWRSPAVRGDIRRISVKRFPYEIYFRALPDSVRVLAVRHRRRNDPDPQERR